MLDQNSTPPILWETAQAINAQIEEMQRQIIGIQKSCTHSFENIMGYEPKYSPRVDGHCMGANVIKSFHCTLCHVSKPIDFPFRQCWRCGGVMKHDRQELCNDVRVHIHKCEKCRHEYDTT